MTSPALVWVARFELAISRFRTERSRQVEPHPDENRRLSLRKESNLRTRAYEARRPPRSAAERRPGIARRSAPAGS